MKKLVNFILVSSLPLAYCTPSLAQEQSVEAIAPMLTQAEIFNVAPDEYLLQASLTGIAYVLDKQSIFNALVVRCPGVQRLDLKTGTTQGSGYCSFEGTDPKDTIYAEWKCSGRLGACTGEMTITSGRGAFQGITGSSQLIVRTELLSALGNIPSGLSVEDAVSLVVWRNLKYQLPQKP